MSIQDTMTATHDCGFSGTLAALALHSCEIQEFGGRCEDYPCCGHTDGGGCQTTPEMTSDFYYRNPQFLHEPGSPEWYDAMDDEGEAPCESDQSLCTGGDLDYVDSITGECSWCGKRWSHHWDE